MRPLAPNSPQRNLRVEAVNRAYADFLLIGMPLEGYPGETIQCRNELDRTNWLGLVRLCENAMRDERAFYEAMQLPVPEVLGDYPIPAPGIRCTSNTFIQPKVVETVALMDDVLAYAKDAQANWWRLKDLCKTALTSADLHAIDLTEGWP